MGRQFTIRTDHRSLKNLLSQVIQTPEQQTFLCKLLGFQYVIEYKPGKDNVVADSLSRVMEEPIQKEGSIMSLSTPVLDLIEELRR